MEERIRRVYVADDGKEFLDEEECRRYDGAIQLKEAIESSGSWYYGAWHLENGQEFYDWLKENEELVCNTMGWETL